MQPRAVPIRLNLDICYEICHHIEVRYLGVASQLSKSWRKVTLPRMFRGVSFPTRQSRYAPFLSPAEFENALKNFASFVRERGRYIRQLSLYTCRAGDNGPHHKFPPDIFTSIMHRIRPACNLRFCELEFGDPPDVPAEEESQIQVLPSLQSLTVSAFFSSGEKSGVGYGKINLARVLSLVQDVDILCLEIDEFFQEVSWEGTLEPAHRKSIKLLHLESIPEHIQLESMVAMLKANVNFHSLTCLELATNVFDRFLLDERRALQSFFEVVSSIEIFKYGTEELSTHARKTPKLDLSGLQLLRLLHVRFAAENLPLPPCPTSQISSGSVSHAWTDYVIPFRIPSSLRELHFCIEVSAVDKDAVEDEEEEEELEDGEEQQSVTEEEDIFEEKEIECLDEKPLLDLIRPLESPVNVQFQPWWSDSEDTDVKKETLVRFKQLITSRFPKLKELSFVE